MTILANHVGSCSVGCCILYTKHLRAIGFKVGLGGKPNPSAPDF
jgi:hypothetical protein